MESLRFDLNNIKQTIDFSFKWELNLDLIPQNVIAVAKLYSLNYIKEDKLIEVGKQDIVGSNIGKVNNQNFVNIRIEKVKHNLEFLCMKYGIKFIEQEESYTSKASFLDNDYIPTYGIDDNNAHFTGKRVHRGLYKSKNGIYINADLNATLNIMKKSTTHCLKTKGLV